MRETQVTKRRVFPGKSQQFVAVRREDTIPPKARNVSPLTAPEANTCDIDVFFEDHPEDDEIVGNPMKTMKGKAEEYPVHIS